ncbi:hypothetical protein D9619_013714 [Psilocybe cf. subviscida]|uniref:HAT C-terminal dimerisation domain-containing protein n=1 Tax=Psilocybe cf. subviscida TaxID=2480587 RepID=A0A8H5B0J0_9AGAR|nr:hypothetical protein D9619_013714 [Psilocybe cf. subviscida]
MQHHSLPSTGENTTPEDPHVPHTNLDGPANVETSEQKGKGKPKEVTTRVGHKRVVKASEKLIKVNENLQGTGLNPGTKRFLQRTLDVGGGTISTGATLSTASSTKKKIPGTSKKPVAGSSCSSKRKLDESTSKPTQCAKRVRTAQSIANGDSNEHDPKGDDEEAEDGYDEGAEDVESTDDEDQASNSEEEEDEGRSVDPEVEAQYTKLKATESSKPRRVHNHRGQDPRTKDLRAVYDKVVDSDNRKGHRCHVCKYFDKHGEYYLKKCQELDIEPNASCIPEGGVQTSPGTDTVQLTLGGFIESVPRWSKDGLLDHIVEFVVEDDQAFNIVEKTSFRALLKYQKPSMKDSDIPHRTKLREEVIHKTEVVMHKLMEHFKLCPSKISITLDAWSSDSYDPYLAITAHYIDAPLDQPCEWTLKKQVIGFEELKGRHNGENMAALTNDVLEQYKIRDKLGWLTSDNATSNDTLVRKIHQKEDKWKPRERRIRCIEHTINLAAGDFIKALGPTTWSYSGSSDESNTDFAANSGNAAEDSNDNTVTDVLDFEAGDTLGKALALVNQCCREEKIRERELLKWVRTRWGSMHDLIERVIESRKALMRFCYYADENLPKLKNKQYADFKIETSEWRALELILEVLAEPRKAQATFSSETETTVWKAIPVLDCLRAKWTMFSKVVKFYPIYEAIIAGLEKLDKWYHEISKRETYYICLVLHPSMKDLYCKAAWSSDLCSQGQKSLEKIFDQYYIPPKKTTTARSRENALGLVSQSFSGYGSDFIMSQLSQSTPQEPFTSASNPRQELTDYLGALREPSVVDPIKWWGYHSLQYPTLSRIARDYLAIQGSSVASERAFSSAGITDDVRRNSLDTKAFGGKQS